MIGADITSVYTVCYVHTLYIRRCVRNEVTQFYWSGYEVCIILERQATKLNSLHDTHNDYLYQISSKSVKQYQILKTMM
jgi:hypothetical protein